MLQVSSDILALTGEALVLVRAGKIAFANAPARAMLGEECVGKRPGAVFSQEIVSAQASSFVADTLVNGRRCHVRVCRQEDITAIFLAAPSDQPVLLNDALIYSLRSALMTMSVSMELCRSRAEELGDAALATSVCALTQSYYSLSRLISNVSAARSILAGELCFAPTGFCLRTLCEEYAEAAKTFLRTPEISVSGAQQLSVTADPNLIGKLLLNLLSNSVLHAKGCTRVSVNLIDAGESVILSVSDNGCGIRSDELHSVFNRYTHGFPITGMNGGAGLGLTVVRGIAEKHGGALLLESRQGYGTSVRVSLRKNLQTALHAPEVNYGEKTGDVLTELADCLPASCYQGAFLD